MSQLIASFRREPALWLGFIGTVFVICAQQALSAGVVTSEGKVNLLQLLIGLVPQIVAIITRAFVSPVPVRPEGG